MGFLLSVVYFLAVLCWGVVAFKLVAEIVRCKQREMVIPSLLLPFTVSSVAFTLSSLYSGVMILDKYLINSLFIEKTLARPDYLIIPEFIVAISGFFVAMEMIKTKE